MNNNSIVKKVLNKSFKLFFLMLICIFILSGCGIENVMEETRLCKEAKEEKDSVFEYLKNEDAKSLSELFSQNEKESHNLEEEWKTFFDEVDGKFVDFDDSSFTEIRRTFSEGKLTFLVVQAQFKDVKTDTGHIYETITYSKTLKSEHDINDEGIDGFSLCKGTDENNDLIMLYVGYD